MFCAVLAWSRYRFVRFATDETRSTTLALLAECFEELGAVPAVVLSDRMGCLKNGIVANLVVPHPDYLRFAAHFGFRPDFCESQDPESNSFAERWVGTARREVLDHLLIFGRHHLARVLDEFIEHYHEARRHQGLGQRRPCEPAEVNSRTYGPVERRDRLGGLLHEYRQAA